MFTSLKRTIKTGWKNFSRNIALSVATISIMIMVVSLATLLFLLGPISDILISDIEEKVDVSVYFKEDVSPEDILAAEEEIYKISEVKEIEYVSKDQALERFTENHKDDPDLLESLTEVGYNPFLASLNIRAWEVSQYGQVASFLETGPFKDLIDKIDYYQRKPVIDKVYALISSINKTGIFFSIILGAIAILVAFNTVRIAIYNSNKEISIMRLVGASNWFIRGPFLIQGIIVGVFAALITLLITLVVCWGLNSRIGLIIPEVSMLGLLAGNFWMLLLIQLATGTGLGVISSLIATRKYLKI